jgi:hypothetical protein
MQTSWWVRGTGGMLLTGENHSTHRKTCHKATLSRSAWTVIKHLACNAQQTHFISSRGTRPVTKYWEVITAGSDWGPNKTWKYCVGTTLTFLVLNLVVYNVTAGIERVTDTTKLWIQYWQVLPSPRYYETSDTEAIDMATNAEVRLIIPRTGHDCLHHMKRTLSYLLT